MRIYLRTWKSLIVPFWTVIGKSHMHDSRSALTDTKCFCILMRQYHRVFCNHDISYVDKHDIGSGTRFCGGEVKCPKNTQNRTTKKIQLELGLLRNSIGLSLLSGFSEKGEFLLWRGIILVNRRRQLWIETFNQNDYIFKFDSLFLFNKNILFRGSKIFLFFCLV